MAVDDELSGLAWNPAAIVPGRCERGYGLRLHVNVLGAPAIARETGLITGVESDEFDSLPAIEKLAVALGGVVKSVVVRGRNIAFGALFLEEHLDPDGLLEATGLADASDLLDGYYSTFSFAFRLAPSVSIGASEIVLSGIDATGRRGHGLGRAYGAILRPNEHVTVGLTYLDLPPEFAHYRTAVEGLGARTMNAGVAYRPFDALRLTFDLRDLSETDPRTSLEPRAGAEWDLAGGAAVRAGAYREDSGKRNVLTLGVGAIPHSVCPGMGRRSAGDTYVLNYAVLLSDGVEPRYLLSAVLHF